MPPQSNHPLRHQLDNTASVSDLLLRQPANPSRLDDNRDLGDAALAEDLGVAEGEEVDNGNGVLLRAANVGVAGLGREQRVQLWEGN